jgi:hypothetical protein
MYQHEPKDIDEDQVEQHQYGAEVHEQIEKHYTDMIHRETGGSDPLVQEPKGKT